MSKGGEDRVVKVPPLHFVHVFDTKYAVAIVTAAARTLALTTPIQFERDARGHWPDARRVPGPRTCRAWPRTLGGCATGPLCANQQRACASVELARISLKLRSRAQPARRNDNGQVELDRNGQAVLEHGEIAVRLSDSVRIPIFLVVLFCFR